MYDARFEASIVRALSAYSTEVLSQSQLRELIVSLSLVQNVPLQGIKPTDLISDLWTTLDAEKRGGASKQALRIVMSAMLGLNGTPTELRRVSQNSPIDGNTMKTSGMREQAAKALGAYDQSGKYSLTGAEAGYLYQKYGLLVKGDLLSRRSVSPPTETVNEEFTYSPRTNKNSIQLAADRRNKVIAEAGKAGTQAPVHEILLMQNQIYAKYGTETSEGRDVLEKKKTLEKEAVAFPFRPKINRRRRSAEPKPCIQENSAGWVKRKREKRVFCLS